LLVLSATRFNKYTQVLSAPAPGGGRRRSARLPRDCWGLVLQVAGQLRMPLAIIRQADGQPRLLVQRTGDHAALGRVRETLLCIELPSFALARSRALNRRPR
jgi:hypothetical protein